MWEKMNQSISLVLFAGAEAQQTIELGEGALETLAFPLVVVEEALVQQPGGGGLAGTLDRAVDPDLGTKSTTFAARVSSDGGGGGGGGSPTASRSTNFASSEKMG